MQNILRTRQISLKFPKISLFPHETIKRIVRFFNPTYDYITPIQYSYKEWTRRSVSWVVNRYLTGLIPNLALYHFFRVPFSIFSVFIFGAAVFWVLEFLKQMPKLIEIKQEVRK